MRNHKFKNFVWEKLNESNLGFKVFPATSGAEPAPQMSHDVLTDIINAVTPPQAKEILERLGLTGKKTINKTNFQLFKKTLLYYVHNRRDLVSAIIKSNSPADFKTVIDYWKHFAGIISPPTPKVAPRVADDEEYSLVPTDDLPKPSFRQEPEVTHKGTIETFPPQGSRLEERLGWALQNEKERQIILSNIILNVMKNNHYYPKGLHFDDTVLQNITAYMQHNYLTQDQKDDLIEQKRIYDFHALKDLAEGKVSPEVLSNIIDTLASSRTARLLANELRWLAKTWTNEFERNGRLMSPPKLTREMINHAVDLFRNQKYYGESLIWKAR